MPHDRRVVLFVNAAHFVDHMFMLIFVTAVLAMGADFQLGYGELLALSTGAFIAFGAGSLPAGWLGDRWSRRNMLAVFFIGIGLAAIGVGFANSPTSLAVTLALVGLFAAIYHPVGTAMLVAHADGERLGREIGVNGVWGNVGVAMAALITGGLVELAGWRAAFIVPGCAVIGLGVVYLWLVADRPAPAKARGGAGADLPVGVIMRVFSVLAVVAVTGGVVFNAVGISLPKLFEERIDVLAATPGWVGAAAAVVYLAGAVAQLIVGRLIDRFSLKTVFVALSALQAPCLLAAAYARDLPLALAAAGIMFAVFGQVTINDAMVAHYTRDVWRARAYALRYLVSFGASAAAVPLVAYLHGSGQGFTTTYAVMAAFGAAVFLGALCFPGRRSALVAA